MNYFANVRSTDPERSMKSGNLGRAIEFSKHFVIGE